MNIPANAVLSTVPILLTDQTTTTIKAKGATGHVAVVHLHLVNETDPVGGVSSRIQILSRGGADTILGYAYCSMGGAGSVDDIANDHAMHMADNEDFGLKVVEEDCVISGFAICYVW